jgi:ankyrin repeat protein
MIHTIEFSSLTPDTPRRVLVSMFTGYAVHMAVVNDAAVDATDDLNAIAMHHGRAHCSPLALAIVLHREAAVQRLLDAGADANRPLDNYHDFWTPVRIAARHGTRTIVQRLVAAHANLVSKRTGHEQSLLHLAALNADTGVLALLLDAGISPALKNSALQPPIFNAATNPNADAVALLLPHCATSVLTRTAGTCTIAHVAAGNRNERVLAMLIAAGATVTQGSSRKFWPIHVAAANPNAAVLRLLLDAGAATQVHCLDGAGETPLFKACSNPNEAVLDLLLAAGADWRDSFFENVSHAAATNPNEALARRIIERSGGGDVRTLRSKFGRSLLHAAALEGTPAVVAYLLRAGVDTAAVDNLHETACDKALLNPNKAVLRLLLAAGAPLGVQGIEKAIRFSNVDALIDAGIRVTDHVVASWSRADHVRYDSGAVLQSLFARGVDVRCAGPKPFRCTRSEALLTLVAIGVDVSQCDTSNGDDDDRALLSAIGLGHRLSAGVTAPRVAWARNRIEERRFELLRARAFQVCVGLQRLRLPALVLCEILANAFAPVESLVAFHRVWAVATTIKHFRAVKKE